jgi:hypothetical protein
MRNKNKLIVLIPIVIFVIAGLMLSCSSLNKLVPQPKTEAGKFTTFQLSGLSISPDTVAARDEVVITAQVTNVTGVDDTYNADLNINGVTEASDKVSVPAGKTQALTFVIFKDAPGTYKVSLGQITGQFVVTESVAAVPGNQPSALPVKTGASCCLTGGSASPVSGQTGAGCCGSGVQNSPTAQPRRSCCGR